MTGSDLFRFYPPAFLANPDARQRFFHQLEREFYKTGMDVSFIPCGYEELLSQLTKILSELSMEQRNRFLYVVDIPEYTLQKFFSDQTDTRNENEKLADLIIRRILMKIFTRYGYL